VTGKLRALNAAKGSSLDRVPGAQKASQSRWVAAVNKDHFSSGHSPSPKVVASASRNTGPALYQVI
jgi:hypothetical protein